VVHVGSYWVLSKVIRSYTSINAPLKKMIKKSKVFRWNPECDQAFNILKENVSTTTMIYINWKVEFHLYIDSFGISLGTILAQLGERNMDNLIYFTSRKISKYEHNYTTIERKVFSMACDLKIFRNYMLGGHFKFFIDHATLKYLVNKLVLKGRICRWFLISL
jgi:hypothetical protein